MKPPRQLPADVLAAKRRAAEVQGWTIRPGTGAGVMVAERGLSTKYAGSLQALLEHLEASARPTLSAPPPAPRVPPARRSMGWGADPYGVRVPRTMAAYKNARRSEAVVRQVANLPADLHFNISTLASAADGSRTYAHIRIATASASTQGDSLSDASTAVNGRHCRSKPPAEASM